MQFTKHQQAALSYDKNIIVEAGAGSGKTAVFVRRYLNIISENPDILPENILAITFTNKAAHECLERIRNNILSDSTQTNHWLDCLSRAHISTIHGFCSHVVKKYSLAIQLSPQFSILDEQDKLYVFTLAMKNTFHTLSQQANPHFKAYLTQFSMSRLTKDLESIFSNHSFFKKHIESIQHQSSHSDSDRFCLILSHIFSAVSTSFTQLKQHLGMLDYDDLFYYFKQLLQQPAIRHELQQQFHYIMIDECQDVDPDQWETIQQLIADINPLDSKKLFLVGDAKQSIYGFRGADLRFFSTLSKQFSQHQDSCSTVFLNDNFRTTSSILNFLNPLFQDLFETDHDHAITYHPLVPFRDTAGSVTCLLLKDATKSSDEHVALYHWINSFLNDHPNYSYQDIAILCRQRKQCHTIKRALESYGLPVHLDREPGFFQEQVVIDLFQFMKMLCIPTDHLAWISVLRSPIIGFNADLIHLFCTQSTASSCLDKLYDYLSWTEETYQNLSMSNQDSILFRKGLSLLKDTFEQHYASTFSPTLKHILTTSGAYSIYTSLNETNPLFIDQFLSIIDNIESQQVFSRFELIQRLEYKLKTTQTSFQASQTAQQSIQIMTIHSSKGLEFPVVICPELHSPFTVKTSSPLLITTDAVHLNVSDDDDKTPREELINHLKHVNIEEEKRLFYVACTRARDVLVLSGLTDSKHYSKPCYLRFLYQAYQPNDTFTALCSTTTNLASQATLINQLSELTSAPLTPPQTPIRSSPKNHKHFHIATIPSLPSLTFTSLSKLEQEQRSRSQLATHRDQFHSYLQLDEAARMGTLMHIVLRDLFEIGPWDTTCFDHFIKTQQLDHAEPLVSTLRSHVESCLQSQFLKQLKLYHLEFEKDFNLLYENNVIRGRFDCVAKSTDKVMIIDFKTEPFKQKDISIIKQKYSLQHKIYLRAATHFFAKQNQQIQLIFYSTADDSTITF